MNSQLNIAMFGHKRIPSREGGIEVVVEELCTRMVKEGHNVCCYNRKGRHVSGEESNQNLGESYKGIRIKRVFTIEKKGIAAVTSSFFASLATALGKYDVVHIHAEGPSVFCWIPKICGKRVICTIHGLDWAREKWESGMASKYIRLGEKCAVRFADEIIVLSQSTYEYFKQTYNRETKYIPNGVKKPVKTDVDLIKKKFGLEKNSYVLFLGRIVPEKGIRYLIDAYRNVNTDKKLIIAGCSSDTDKFVAEIKRMSNGDNRIVFTGFVHGQVLEELYSNAYIYILPSDLEGMPLTLLEAMSYGNCCLTSDIEECTAVVGDYGLTFAKKDVDDLRDKIQMLCNDEEMVQRYKQKAADYICAKYNWDDVVEETLALYRQE